MKRIGLFLAIEPTWGGAFQYGQSILDAMAQLPRDKFEIVVGYSHYSWMQHLDRYLFKTVPIPLGFWGRFFGQLLHYSQINTSVWRALTPFFHPTVRSFLREQCDLWIFPSQDPWSYLAPVPALATIHDLMHRYEQHFPEVGNHKEYWWREWHYRNICRWSKGVLVDSAVGMRQVAESYEIIPSGIHVLPYVPPAYLDENSPDVDCQAEYSLPDKFIFYPAQFWEHKNHALLIEALALLKPCYPDIKLVLVGGPKNAYGRTLRMIDNLELNEQVYILGYVPDSAMKNLYQRARALVMPTFFGPTNIPPLEAMHAGCPVAVSNVYGMAEQTGGAAVLFDPASAESIAVAIGELWENDELCRTLVARGREVSSRWTKIHFSERLAEIIHAVVREP